MTLTIEEKIRLGAASIMDFEKLGAERVAEIKSDGEFTHYRGCAHVALKAGNEVGDRKILRLIASTPDKDHYGDRISVRGKNGGKGWLLDAYNRQGGVYLWSHNLGSTKAPIGQALKTWRGVTPDGKSALLQDVEFLSADAGPDDHFKFAETVYLIMSGKGTRSGKGMMGSSVGFVPTRVYAPETKEEREKLDIGPYGVEFHEQVLLENSATPTPANPFASVIDSGARKSFEAQVLDALEFIEERSLLPASLISDFRKRAVLGPQDAEDKLQERLKSRVFIFSKDSSTSVPDDATIVDVDEEREAADEEEAAADDATADEVAVEAVTDEPKSFEERLLEGVTFESRDSSDAMLRISPDARDVLSKAYEAADFLTMSLGMILDVVDKNTDPDTLSPSGEGTTLDEISERLHKIEDALKLTSRSKATERADESMTRKDAEAVISLLFPKDQ